MAELQQTQVLPAPFIQAAAQTYLDDLTSAVGDYSTANLAQTMGPQFVAGLDPLQQQAASLTQQGVGSFRPFIQSAQASTGPQAYEAFMSPYQRDVISTTLQDFDRQAQKGLGSIAQNAITAGAFGGARQGVAESEYMAQSDICRAPAGALQISRSRDCWSTNNWFRFTSTKPSSITSTTTIGTSTTNATNTGCTNIWFRRNRFNCWISRPNNKPDDLTIPACSSNIFAVSPIA